MLSPYHPLQLSLGLIVWITWFVLMYGALTVFCEIAPPPIEYGPFTWINVMLLLGTLTAIGLLLYGFKKCRHAARACNQQDSSSHQFIARIGAGIYLAATMATLSLGLMTLPLPPCL